MEGESPRLFAWLNGANEAPSQAELFAQVSQLQRTVQALTDELMELRKERRRGRWKARGLRTRRRRWKAKW